MHTRENSLPDENIETNKSIAHGKAAEESKLEISESILPEVVIKKDPSFEAAITNLPEVPKCPMNPARLFSNTSSSSFSPPWLRREVYR